MEGYREPDARPDPPELALCEKHGLRFDPAVQPGCTICRRVSAPSQCLLRCSNPFGSNDACPSGFTCTRVANSLMPLEPMMMQDYCVPNR
jgi:hypothetical protein